jgi:pimeloyl-ACP methyl ester carboxylesterase
MLVAFCVVVDFQAVKPTVAPGLRFESSASPGIGHLSGETVMAVFVLVHGSWHEGAAWQGVIRHLENKGDRAFAPTVAGYGLGANKNVNHAQCTKSIVDFILEKSLSDFILVGHAFGGTCVFKVAEAIPERIRRLASVVSCEFLVGKRKAIVCF